MAHGYSLNALLAAQQALADVMLDASAGTPAIWIYDDAPLPQVLVIIELDLDQSGVDPNTAVLALVTAADHAALLDGHAGHADICDGASLPHLRLPCTEGNEAVAGYCVLSRLDIQAEAPVTLRTCLLPPGPLMS